MSATTADAMPPASRARRRASTACIASAQWALWGSYIALASSS